MPDAPDSTTARFRAPPRWTGPAMVVSAACLLNLAGCASWWPWSKGSDRQVVRPASGPNIQSNNDRPRPDGPTGQPRPGDATANRPPGADSSAGGGVTGAANGPGTEVVPSSAQSPVGDLTVLPPSDQLPILPTAEDGLGNALPADSRVFAAAQAVAQVGNQIVLAGDVDGTVNLMLAINMAKVPEQERERFKAQIEAQRQALFRQQLQSEIQIKLGYLDFIREVPSEKLPELQKRVNESFAKELDSVREKLTTAKEEALMEQARREPVLSRLALLMRDQQIETLGELDATLRRYGSSLEKQQRAYGEHKLSQMAVFRHIRQNVEVTHDDMLNYYREHEVDFAIAARARWEQLSVRLDKFPDEAAAYAALAAMGNEVYLGGAPLAAVAKRSSQEPNADKGGYYDWTNKGSLASRVLDDAIFSLPLNRLSEILRDERGLHIVRVLEREDATHVPFLEAQVDIKEKIRNERRMADVQAYLEKLRTNTRVWTVYDEPK